MRGNVRAGRVVLVVLIRGKDACFETNMGGSTVLLGFVFVLLLLFSSFYPLAFCTVAFWYRC